MTDAEYRKQLHAFVKHLGSLHKFASVENGRFYDRIYVGTDDTPRYYVARSTRARTTIGDIYGAKSATAPNLKWYFGTLHTYPLWDWSDYHGTPVNDTSVIAVAQYGPYVRYIKRG